MDSNTSNSLAIATGATFASWDEFKYAMEDWAIAEFFDFRVEKKNQKKAVYCCSQKNTGCAWRISALLNKNGEIQVKKCHNQHICAGTHQRQSRVANQQSWLRRAIPQHLFVTKDT